MTLTNVVSLLYVSDRKGEKTMENESREYITFTVTASDGNEVELAVIEEFEFDKKEYVAAARVVGDEIDMDGVYLYKVKPGAEFEVEKILNQVEYQKIAKAFQEMEDTGE